MFQRYHLREREGGCGHWMGCWGVIEGKVAKTKEMRGSEWGCQVGLKMGTTQAGAQRKTGVSYKLRTESPDWTTPLSVPYEIQRFLKENSVSIGNGFRQITFYVCIQNVALNPEEILENLVCHQTTSSNWVFLLINLEVPLRNKIRKVETNQLL